MKRYIPWVAILALVSLTHCAHRRGEEKGGAGLEGQKEAGVEEEKKKNKEANELKKKMDAAMAALNGMNGAVAAAPAAGLAGVPGVQFDAQGQFVTPGAFAPFNFAGFGAPNGFGAGATGLGATGVGAFAGQAPLQLQAAQTGIRQLSSVNKNAAHGGNAAKAKVRAPAAP